MPFPLKLASWKENFQSTLNRSDPKELANIHPAEHNLSVCTDLPTLDKVTAAIKSMKNGKAPGADSVTAEMLMANYTETHQGYLGEQTGSRGMENWFNFKLMKKGDLSGCSNWIGITLFSLAGKVLSNIVFV